MLLKYGLQTGCRNFSRRLDPGTCEVHVERPCFCAHPRASKAACIAWAIRAACSWGEKASTKKGRSLYTPALSYASFNRCGFYEEIHLLPIALG